MTLNAPVQNKNSLGKRENEWIKKHDNNTKAAHKAKENNETVQKFGKDAIIKESIHETVKHLKNPTMMEATISSYAQLLEDENAVNVYGEHAMYEQYERTKEEIGKEFNFMEDKDPSDQKAYTEQLGKLAEGDIDMYDTDKNNEVSWEEYVSQELLDAYDASPEDRQMTATIASLMFSIIDEGMGNSDSNGVLSKEEFESFYRNLDRFNGNELGDTDGKLEIDAVSEFANYLISNIFSESTVQAEYDKMEGV